MRAFLWSVTLVWNLFIVVAAQAHTSLVASAPAEGESTLPPAAITLTFGAEVRLVDVRVTHDKAGGINLEKARDLTPATEFTIPVPPLSPGAYRVEWIAMGGDSHKMTGEFGFSVEGVSSP